MKILIHTQYFPPEIGAPQNRLFELAVRLQKMGAQVDVLTAMPNYPAMVIHETYRGKRFMKEELEGLTVFRSWIYVAGSKRIVQRLLNYFSFVFSSLIYGVFRLKKYDIILCESPPLFLGISSWLLAKLKGAKLVFNVSDLWPESAERLGLVTNRFFLNWAYRLEAFLYRKSWLVTGQTQGIVADIKKRFPEKDVYWLPNGVDLSFYDPDNITTTWRQDNGFTDNQLIFLYAGIIGHAQGLEVILEAAGQLKEMEDIQFVLLGEGPEKDKLLKQKERQGLSNVHFFPAVPKTAMPFVVMAATMAVIPLKKLPIFEGAIPSKIFENLAMKKPILLGVNGEARTLFIEEGKCGLYFEPENPEALVNCIMQVKNNNVAIDEMKENARAYIKRKFDREKIANALWIYLKSKL